MILIKLFLFGAISITTWFHLQENGESCTMWRRFANLWETSQSLFWASFGLVDLGDFDLSGIKEFTRFWGLLMFGSYSVCNIIVLLNMLIAMMSNSYTLISSKSDVEWKFARSKKKIHIHSVVFIHTWYFTIPTTGKLWISYFEEGSTVPPPFNMIPTPKSFKKILMCKRKKNKEVTEEQRKSADNRYYG